MTIIAINTKDGYNVSAHTSRKAAVKAVLSDLGNDYADRFWASEDGTKIVESTQGMRDFGVAIYDSVDDAIKGETQHADEDAVEGISKAILAAV